MWCTTRFHTWSNFILPIFYDMCKVSTVMTRIIFADGTNLTICINGNNIETFYTTDCTLS